MSLPLRLPLAPMLARAQARIPSGMAYEPKWDGFRCLVSRDNDDVQLISRSGKDLGVYFPEVVEAVQANTPPRCVLDGELVVVVGDRLDFVRLTERIHPAKKRIALLSTTMPASLVFWDLLALDDTDLTGRPFAERRALLERALANSEPPIHLTPITQDRDLAGVWFTKFEGAGLDGVIAKPLDQPYQPGVRAMIKVKHAREADVVVAGWRESSKSSPARPMLGALQLGLYDELGVLHFVGVSSSFPDAQRAELAAEFVQSTLTDSSGHPWAAETVEGRRPGSVSRWSSEIKQTNLIWPARVCEVGYTHMEGTRFRYPTKFRRRRPDREPGSCTFDQLERVVKFDLAQVLAGNP